MPENTNPAGATPAAGSATPPQTPPQAQTPPAGQPADGDPLGQPGLNALQAEREARKEAERQLKAAQRRAEELELAGKSESEKAIAQARKEGETAARQAAANMVRRAEVRRELAEAGCSDVAVAAMAAEFGALEVDDDGNVKDLSKTIAAFKAAHPTLFAPAKPRPTGSADGGTGTPGSGNKPTFTREQIADPKFFADNRAAVMEAVREGRITN